MSNISDILATIEAKGEWIRRDAKALADFVNLLPFRRDFLTKAEDAMDLAEKELLRSLQVVRASRQAFTSKPVEQSHVA